MSLSGSVETLKKRQSCFNLEAEEVEEEAKEEGSR
jgi:hypothetical protein